MSEKIWLKLGGILIEKKRGKVVENVAENALEKLLKNSVDQMGGKATKKTVERMDEKIDKKMVKCGVKRDTGRSKILQYISLEISKICRLVAEFTTSSSNFLTDGSNLSTDLNFQLNGGSIPLPFIVSLLARGTI